MVATHGAIKTILPERILNFNKKNYGKVAKESNLDHTPANKNNAFLAF